MPEDESKIGEPQPKQNGCVGGLQLISGMYSSSDGSDDEMEKEEKMFQDVVVKEEKCIIREVIKEENKNLHSMAIEDQIDIPKKEEESDHLMACDEKENNHITITNQEKIASNNIATEEKCNDQKPSEGQSGHQNEEKLIIISDAETFGQKANKNHAGTPDCNGAGDQIDNSKTFTGISYKEPRESMAEKTVTECITVDTDSDSVSSLDSAEDSDTESDGEDNRKKNKQPPLDMTYNDLPPIEDLHISVPHEKCKLIGSVKSVVDPLVIVESIRNLPVLNLDSVLFLDKGDRSLGHIFDVIGKVEQPHYCVRFNSKEHIEKNGVHPGMPVYCAPSTDYTAYVFLAQLRQLKGTDASWKDDYEPPNEEQEFSDDDAERMAKKGGRKRKTKKKIPTADDASPSQFFGENPCNGNQRRGFKRPQGNNNYFHQQQNGPNHYQSRFIPPFVAGFAPPPHFRPPPFNAYGQPRPYFPRTPQMEFNRFGQFNGAPNECRFENTPFVNNRCPPPPRHFNPSHPPYNMWGPQPQPNYWQRPPAADVRSSPVYNFNGNQDEQHSKLPPPPPPGV